jgi:hypothetical protein
LQLIINRVNNILFGQIKVSLNLKNLKSKACEFKKVNKIGEDNTEAKETFFLTYFVEYVFAIKTTITKLKNLYKEATVSKDKFII